MPQETKEGRFGLPQRKERMMNKICGLEVVEVLLQKNQSCLWREERVQTMTLTKVRNEQGQEGHVVFCVETDKRDVLDQSLFTDNPDLFAEEKPQGHELIAFCGLDAPEENPEAEETLWATIADEPVFEDGHWLI